jgi:hypothetical protein
MGIRNLLLNGGVRPIDSGDAHHGCAWDCTYQPSTATWLFPDIGFNHASDCCRRRVSIVLEISRKRSFLLTIPAGKLEFTHDNYVIASVEHAEKIAK